MAEINWTRESEIWLKDIYNYIAADSPEAAERTIMNIYQKAQLLSEYPRLGHRYEPEQAREVRILLYEHYRITYVIKPKILTFSVCFMEPWILIATWYNESFVHLDAD